MADIFVNEKQQMQSLTRKYVEKLISMWITIFDDKSCKYNLEKLLDCSKDFFEDLIQETMACCSNLKDDIKKKKKEAKKLKRALQIDLPLPEYNQGEVPLIIVQLELEQKLKILKEQLQEKRQEISNILIEQNTLCEELNEPPYMLTEDSLLTIEEIEESRKYLDKLRNIKKTRFNEITNLRKDIKNFLCILKVQVKTTAEDQLLNKLDIKLNQETVNSLQNMYNYYDDEVKQLKENIDNMRSKLENLWENLNVSPCKRKKFRYYAEYNKETYDIIYAELKRCQTIKNRNIKQLVLKIREEIRVWWDKTLKSEAERNNFFNFYNDCYTNDLLELHELELMDLKRYYEENRQLFDLYATRNVLWDRMIALIAKASEPSRYNNRGGQLLKEEKERKTVATKLPKIEQQIHDLVRQYEARENKPFLVYGENIVIVIASQWEEQRIQKEKLSSARKNATKTTSILKNGTFVAANVTSLKKVPTSVNSLKMHGASTTGRKRKLPHLEKGPPLAKRSLIKDLNIINISNKSGATNKNIITSEGKALATQCKSNDLKNKSKIPTTRQLRYSKRYNC